MADSNIRKTLDVDAYVSGVLASDRTVLAQAITLVESNAEDHRKKAVEVLEKLVPHAGNSIRVGVTGVPGVGKSTFIDALGSILTAQGRKVAVLAVDPSSSITKGSILGDKTRMDSLANDPAAFIRPSPTGGTLGGVAKKSRETILVCEAAGFNVILIETVGVGQSEVTVRSMVDFFMLLMIAGAGDELQGIKRGVMELADTLLINKADGDNVERAEVTCSEYNRALHYLLPATHGWRTKAHTCSAKEGTGVREAWDIVEHFQKTTKESGVFYERRKSQILEWFHNMILDHLRGDFFSHNAVKKELPLLEKAIVEGNLPLVAAVDRLVSMFKK